MIVPTIHLNGTSGKALLEQVTDARFQALKLVDALVSMAPNGRDYYPQGQTALKQAQGENNNRIAMVKSVCDELAVLAGKIADAMDPQ